MPDYIIIQGFSNTNCITQSLVFCDIDAVFAFIHGECNKQLIA